MTTRPLTFPRTLLVALTLGLLAVLPASAEAATYALRPVATAQRAPAWTTTPPGGTLDAALGDPILQPAPPATGDAAATAGTGNEQLAVLPTTTPNLAAGESETTATVWVYAKVGAAQQLFFGLLTGTTTSGYTVQGWSYLSPGQAAGWASVRITTPLTPAQLGQMAIALRSDGTAQPRSTTTVYAAYVQLDTSGGATAPDGGTTAGPADPGTAGGGSTPTGATSPGASDTTSGGSSAPGSGLGAIVAPPSPPVVISPPPAQVAVGPRAPFVPVGLGCPAAAIGGCRGLISIRLLEAPTPARRRAFVARCARGCRVLGQGRFDIAAGRRRRFALRISAAAQRLLPRGRSVRAEITVTAHDALRGDTVSRRIVRLRRR